MRTLNVRLAAILVVAGIIFLVGVYFLHGYQVRGNAGVFLEEAENAQKEAAKAKEAKNFAAARELKMEAVTYLNWYVNLNPADLDAAEKLGMLQADLAYEGNRLKSLKFFGQAFGRLESVVRQRPEQTKARLKLVEMAMFAGRFPDAKAHLQGYLLRESPNDADLLQKLGECQVETGEYKAAQQTFEKALRANPKQYRVYPRLAVLFRVHFSRPKDGDELMKQLVTANPDSYMAHLLRGHYLIEFKMDEEAYEEVMKAMKLAPENPEVLELAAKAALSRKQMDLAREYASRGIKLHPGNVEFYNLMADVESREGSREKAIAVLEQGLKATNRNVRILLTLGNILIDAGKVTEAQQIVKEARDPNVSSDIPASLLTHFVNYLASRIEFAQGHWLAACQGFEQVRGPLMNSTSLSMQIDMQLATCYRQLGNRDQEEKSLRRVLRMDPTHAPAKMALVELHSSKGKVDVAMEEFQKLTEEGQLGEAGPAMEAQLLYQKVMREPAAKRDWASVEAAITKALAAKPGLIGLEMMRAEVLVSQNRLAEAERMLLEASKKDPKQIAYSEALIKLAGHQKLWEKAEQLLQDLEKQVGDSAQYRLAQGTHLVRRYGKGATERLRKLAENTDKFTDAQRLQLWNGLCDLAIQLDDAQQADVLSRRLAEKQPNNARIRYQRWARAYRAGDQKAMAEALQEIEQVAGKGWHWLYGQAVLLRLRALESKNPEELYQQALANLAKARELRSDWRSIPLEEGLIYDQLGKPEQALKGYLQAYDLGDRSLLVVGRTIDLLMLTQQFAEADRRLQELENEVGTLPVPLLRASVEIALQQGKLDRAIEMIQRAVAANTKEYRELLWLGRTCANLANRMRNASNAKEGVKLLEDGEKALRRAVEIDPKRPDAWVMLVQLLVDRGKPEQAEAVVKEANAKLTGEVAMLALAQCNELLRKGDVAEKQYAAAIAAAPNNVLVVRNVSDFYGRTGKYDKAEVLLKKLVDGQIKSEASDVAWARRQLATIYTARGGRRNLQEAQRLIDENLASRMASLADRRTKIQLLASEDNRQRRAEAIRMLQQMVDEQTATADDRFQLARLYLGIDDWTRASDQLRYLVVNHDQDPRYLVLLIEGLLNHGATADADLYLNRLEKIAPNWYPAVHLRALLLCDQNQPERAVELLMQFLDKRNAVPQDHSTRVYLVAQEFDQLSQRLNKPSQKAIAEDCVSRAELLYEAYVKERPGRELILAGFLARRGKLDEAIDLVSSAAKSHPAGELAAVASVILMQNKATPEQLTRLLTVLQRPADASGQALALMLVLGDIQMRRGKYAEAEKLYQENISINPENYVAMNNLAVLLTLQGKRLDEALKLINRALELTGPLGQLLDTRGTVYIAMQQADKALADINEALRDRETAERYFHQAQALLLSGSHRAAKNALEKAVGKGLTKESLQPLEVPIYEKLMKALK